MIQTLDRERPLNRGPSRTLSVLAHVTAGYPLLILISLYGQWLLSWWVLGYRPQPSLNDPKYIDGASWMHLVTLLALMGFLPAGCGAVVFNTLYMLKQRVRAWRWLWRIAVFVPLWLGTFLLLRWDPGLVVYWWLD